MHTRFAPKHRAETSISNHSARKLQVGALVRCSEAEDRKQGHNDDCSVSNVFHNHLPCF